MKTNYLVGTAVPCRPQISPQIRGTRRDSRPYQGSPRWLSAGARPLVPKLHLGTHLSAKLCFTAEATKLRGQARSQVQLGNEESGGNS
jgi:hypothetical protein